VYDALWLFSAVYETWISRLVIHIGWYYWLLTHMLED